MAKLTTLLKEYIISLGDPREPAKLFLGEVWDSIIPPKNQSLLLVDAVYDALLIESKENKSALTKADLHKLLDIDDGDINFENLDDGELSKQLEMVLRDIDIAPERTRNQFDYDQIARNVVRNSYAVFDKKLRAPENHELLRELTINHARSTGIKVDQLEKDLNRFLENTNQRINLIDEKVDYNLNRTIDLEKNVSNMQDSIQNIDDTLFTIAESVRLLEGQNQIGDISVNYGEESSVNNRRSTLIRLRNYRMSLEAYKLSWSAYVSSKDIPVQEVRDVLDITSKVNTLTQSINNKD